MGIKKAFDVRKKDRKVVCYKYEFPNVCEEVTDKSNCATSTKIVVNLMACANMFGKVDRKIKAESICRDGDQFNERIGKELASDVADKKYHDMMARRYSHIISQLERAITDLTELRDKHNKKVDNINQDIKRWF